MKLTEKENWKCNKYYIIALFLSILLLLISPPYHDVICKKYISIRDAANKDPNVQFLSSVFTLFGFSALYGLGKLYNRFANREKQLTKHIHLMSRKDNIKEKIKEKNIQKEELEKQEKELKEKTIKKGQELSRKVAKKEDYSLLLSEIKTLEKELKDTQEELSKLVDYPS